MKHRNYNCLSGTFTTIEREGGNDTGLSVISHTKIWITYNPDSIGNQDWVSEKDCNEDKDQLTKTMKLHHHLLPV
jgi:hypothetical protein